MTARIRKLISGGQTGVDRAALDFAIEHRIPYGGWVPRNGRAEDMPNPPGLLAVYPKLREHSSSNYNQRTEVNIYNSGATLIILDESRPMGPGTKLTIRLAAKHSKPLIQIDINDAESHQKLERFLKQFDTNQEHYAQSDADIALNVAGSREFDTGNLRGRETGLGDVRGTVCVVNKPSLAETHPEIAAQAHGWDPTTVTHGTNDIRQWKCEFDHVWRARVDSRTSGSGCAVCDGRQISVGVNDLKTTHPEIAAQAHGWDPTTVTRGVDKIREWKCSLGHVWSAQVASRTVRHNGCPYCGNRKLLKGFNDLATTRPDVAAQAFGWDPATVMRGNMGKRDWICGLGHVWSTTIFARTVIGTDCPYCKNRKILKGFNDLATIHPEIANEACGWDPTTVFPRTDKRLEWQCGRGHRWFARVRNRTIRGHGCPGCYNMTYEEMTQRPRKFRDKQRKYT